MKLKRSLLKRKIRFQKWKDRVLFRIDKDLFFNRLLKKLPLVNSLLPVIPIDLLAIKFKKNTEIPALAWGMKIEENGQVFINYGEKVFHFEKGVVEGTWDNDFSQFGFQESPYFFGSGITIATNSVVVSTPSHFYEGVFLFYNKVTNSSYFSNSLNYVLKENVTLLGDDFERIINEVCLRNDEITAKGIFDIETLLYESSNFAVHVFYYHNVVLNGRSCEIEAKKPSAQYYNSFKAYKDYLLGVLKRINSNSNSKKREKKYSTLATLSSGYDSSAVASLLTDIGEVEAVTIDVSIAGNDDSGMEIAKHLGLDCKPCSHPLAIDDEIENLGTFNYSGSFADATSEFLATVGHGDEIVFQSFDQYLDHRVAYTGHSGDDLWAINSRDFIGIPVTIINGKSLSEYRLRKNFFHVPLPVIGAVYPFSLHNINYQKDMKKYWIENIYNRPIARRFIEDKGVPRGTFAQSKRSTNPYILNTSDHKVRAFQLTMERYSWQK